MSTNTTKAQDKKTTRTSSDASIALQQQSPARPRSLDDFVDAFNDARVISALHRALGPLITDAVDAAVERKLAPLQLRVSNLEAAVEEIREENGRLHSLAKGQGVRLEEIELYSR